MGFKVDAIVKSNNKRFSVKKIMFGKNCEVFSVELDVVAWKTHFSSAEVDLIIM